MHERGKSDSPVVPASPPNNAAHAGAEAGEGRGLAEGNAASKTRPGRRAGVNAPSALDRVRRVAEKDREARFTALLHHVDLDRLRAAYWALNPKAATGVDGVTWRAYGQNLEANLQDLHGRVHGGSYRPRPSRRAYIAKADRRMLRLIRKWLKAGVIEDGIWSESVEGTPQGASASPLLANVYLHYVFDLWAERWRRRKARGDVIIVRFADDYIVGFEHERDARRFLADLRGRFAKFGLELAAEKTRLIEFGRFAPERRRARGLGKPETLAFLGFTHTCAKDRSGRFALKRITDSKRMRAKLRQVKQELARRRHQPIPEQGRWLASVVRGHCAYYAVPSNSRAVKAFRTQVTRHWSAELRRRGQRHRLDWKRMNRIATRWLPPARIMHPFPETRFDARTRGRSPVR